MSEGSPSQARSWASCSKPRTNRSPLRPRTLAPPERGASPFSVASEETIMRSYRVGFESMAGRGMMAFLVALLLVTPAATIAGPVHAPAKNAAASTAAETPAPAAPVHQQVLDNGLRLLLQEDHSKPLVGVCLFVNGGSRTETPTLSGLSHYYEHLIFRGGSTKQKELEFRREMQRLGEESGGYTTNDYTCY